MTTVVNSLCFLSIDVSKANAAWLIGATCYTNKIHTDETEWKFIEIQKGIFTLQYLPRWPSYLGNAYNL